MLDLRSIAHALGGEVSGAQVLAPGPGHSRRDRSLSVRLSPDAPDGFLAFSHAGDDWRTCRDHVRDRLGISREVLRQVDAKLVQLAPVFSGKPLEVSAQVTSKGEGDARIGEAVALFRASVDPVGTVVERYFASRSLEIGDLAGRVVRWNGLIGAVVCLFRNIHTGSPQAVTRVFLDAEGRKVKRMFMGPTKDAAVMLDGFDSVTHGLHVCEGVETGQAARQLGLRPTWALGSKGAIGTFPVLGGIETLTILAENDGKCDAEVEACGSRWHEAGREVLITRPFRGKDINDVIKGAA